MTEKGSDELLAEIANADTVNDGVDAEEYDLEEEEERLLATAPADDEPGKGYPDPDQTPDEGTPPEFDPLPPEADDGA